jgi:diguanylate cyclase (GGDEF)-like protein/PAS domain S-box-containing protein
MWQSNVFKHSPGKIRMYYGLLLVLALALIWWGYFAFMSSLEESRLQGLQRKATLETLLFEDYASRNLDSVQVVLKSMTMLTNPQSIKEKHFTAELIKEAIELHPMIRSLSLVDANGYIIASSEPRNLKFKLTDGQMKALKYTPDNPVSGYGQVRNRRDFYPDQTPNGSELSFWPIGREIVVGQDVYKWVATVNLWLYKNLWTRSDAYPSTSFGLLNLSGEWILHSKSDEDMPAKADIAKEVILAMHRQDMGYIDVGRGANLIKVAYRVSKDHPIIMLSMNDMKIFHEELNSTRNNRLAIALAASFLVGLIVLALFMTYVRYEESAVETENQNKAISTHLMMTEFTPKGVITNVNDRLVEVSGYAKEELIGQPYQVFDYEFSSIELSKSLFASIESGKIWQGVYRKRKKSGEFYWVNATIIPFTDVWGKIIRYSAYYTDITQAISMREKFENERRMREELTIVNRDLVKDSNTDPLTRLFNRRAFDAFITQAIKSAKDRTQPISILMLDLDFFKRVNDTYGHAGGDEVLKESGKRWLAQIRGSDMLARIGGEEFCIVLPETTMAQAELVAEKIILATRENLFTIKTPDGGSESFPVTVSIGVASTDHFPEGFSPEMFMNVADSALYRAKHGGRNQFVSQRVEIAPNI